MSALHVLQTVETTRADYGGTSRSVPALCDALAAHGLTVGLHAGHRPGDEGQAIWPASPVRVGTTDPEGGRTTLGAFRWALRFEAALARRLAEERPDVLHDHGVWRPTNWAAARAARRAGLPLVVSPRGMLLAWALGFNGPKKRAAWGLYQRRALRGAALLHATSEAEADDLRQLGLRQPVAIVPNGVHVPAVLPTPERNGRSERTALFLSRVHPKKGLPLLIEAWAQVRPVGWRLVVAGPDEGGHRAELEAQVAAAGLNGRVEFAGPVADADKWAAYASADLFVLPSHSENFGAVVAEALGAGLPVLTTTAVPWPILETHRCGWRVEVGVESLAAALREALALGADARRGMGERGRAYVTAHLSWGRAAAGMDDAYRWLMHGGRRPDWVHLG